MSAEALVFDILAVLAVISAAGVVLARNPVHSAVSLVITFINVAAVYLILRAEFLAAVQIIVYTGAILVLVLFVIMLVHQEDLPEFHGGRPVQRLLGFVLGVMLFGEVAVGIVTRTTTAQPGPWTPEAVQSVGGNVQAIGQVLYSGYVLPVQTTALILLAATVGALVLARPEVPKLRVEIPRQIFTISLGHPRGTDGAGRLEDVAALGPGYLKPEAGERELVMAKSGEEFVDQPVWGEREQK
jgi:NADH-quinone oxidoreductase subunit J